MELPSGARARFSRSLILCLLFAGLLASRRGAQLSAPQVWCEEGVLVRGFLDHGWSSIGEPMPLYLVVVPRLLVRAALSISVYNYPLISTICAWVFTAFV